MSSYIKAHGKVYDVEQFTQYSAKVRKLTERTYRCFKLVLNPHNYTRGLGENDYHLDHKTSIITCFKNGLSESAASDLSNLELLPSRVNLKKGRTNSTLISSDIIPAIFNVLKCDDKFEFISDFENVFETNGKLLIRWSELQKSPIAVLSRIKLKLRHSSKAIPEQQIKIAPVDKLNEHKFLTTWHHEGYIKSTECYGLWFKEKLISLMSFSAKSLLRFSQHGEYSISNSAHILWSHWLKINPSKSILYYTKVRWDESLLFKNLGFMLVKRIPQVKFFWKSDQQIRSQNDSMLKAKGDNLSLASLTVKINDPGIEVWQYIPKN